MYYAYLLFGAFLLLMFGGVPIAAALGLSGTLVIALNSSETDVPSSRTAL